MARITVWTVTARVFQWLLPVVLKWEASTWHQSLAADAALRGNLRDQRQVPHEQLGSAQETCRVFATAAPIARDDCQHVGDMDECVDACRACAQSCEKMANAVKRQKRILENFQKQWLQIDQLLAGQFSTQDSAQLLAN